MRITVLALLLATQTAALAQTPADIAHQIWPLGAPAATGSAPIQGATGGAATGSDLAQRIFPRGTQAPRLSANWQDVATAGAFTAADLARLSGNSPASQTTNLAATPIRTALAEHLPR
jgi:hypothetical protein